jgi:hypothetical protein
MTIARWRLLILFLRSVHRNYVHRKAEITFYPYLEPLLLVIMMRLEFLGLLDVFLVRFRLCDQLNL